MVSIQRFANLPRTLQYDNAIGIAISLTDLHQHILVLDRVLPLRRHDPLLLPLLLHLLPHPLPLPLQRLCQSILEHTTQESSFSIRVKEGNHALSLLRRFQRFMVRELAREQQVGVHVLEDRVPRPGTDGACAHGDVFDLPVLRDGDGEADGVADAARYALDDVGEGLWGGEGDEAAHARRFEACRLLARERIRIERD